MSLEAMEAVRAWRVRPEPAVVDRVTEDLASRRVRARLIVGPPGIGKSTLLRAVADRLRTRGMRVIPIAGAAADRDVPLAAFAPLLSAAPGSRADEPTNVRLQQVYDAVVPARSDYALIVDDADRLDAQSATVIARLVRGYGVRALLAAPSAQALGDELAPVLEDDTLRALPVPRLDAAAAAIAIEEVLGGRVDPTDLRAVIDRAGGNPRHLRELVHAAVRHGDVEDGPHGYRLHPGLVPPRLRRTVAQQYDSLDAAARREVEILAAAGRLPRPEEPGRIEAYDVLETAGLAERLRGGAVRFVEPLHAEVLLGLLPAVEREERALAATDWLARSADPVDRHRAVVVGAATSRPPATADLVEAAAHAHANDDHALAVDLAERAIELAERRGEAVPWHARLARADALSFLGRLAEAEVAFASIAAEAEDDAILARCASLLGFHHSVRRSSTGEGARAAQAMRARLRDPAAIAYLDSNVQKLRFWSGGGLPDPEIDAADDVARLSVELLRISSAVFTGDLAAARASIERARPLAQEHCDVLLYAPASVDFGEFLVLVDETRGLAAAAHLERAKVDRDNESKGMWVYGEALLAWVRGDASAAYEAASRAEELLAWRDHLGALAPARMLRAAAAATTDRVELARSLLRGVQGELRTNLPTDLQAAEAEAWLRVAEGDVDGAGAALAGPVRRGVDTGHPTFAALAAHAAVRMGRPEAVLPLLRRAGAIAPAAPIVTAALTHAEALAARDAEALLRFAVGFESSGFDGWTLSAARQAAEIARAQGAAGLARRAGAIVSRLGGHLAGPAAPDALSAREMEIARAAADRMRNREIADRLGISPRTVENHLARVYRKLGVEGRDDLAAALH